jgi:uncharacterized membrane protein
MQPSRLRDRLRSSLWFVPALFGIAAVVLAFVLVRVDRGLDNSTLVGFGGGPESARSVLSTVAASTITFAGLVFSIWHDSGSARRLIDEQSFLAGRGSDGPASTVLPEEPW